MSEIEIIKKDLEKIYKRIPEFDCKHCHECCGPIIWFKIEEILIKDYMERNGIENVKWTKEEFGKNNMKCPFLKNDRCIIYNVRPIVCRLQGNVLQLPCKFKKDSYISEDSIEKIKKDFYELNEKYRGIDIFYSTRKLTKI